MRLKVIGTIVIGLVLLFIIALLCLGSGDILQGDGLLFTYLNPGQGHPTGADGFFVLFSTWGPGNLGLSLYLLMVLVLGLAIFSFKFPRLRYFLLVMFLGVIIYLGTDIILGMVIPRARPFLNSALSSNAPDLFPNISQLFSSVSFPSTHTGVTFAILGPILVFGKYWAKGLALFYGGLLAYSRIFIGVHYPSDIFAGGMIGFLIALIFCSLLRNKLESQVDNVLGTIKRNLEDLT